MVWALTAHLPTAGRAGAAQRMGVSALAAVERGFADAVARQIRGGVLRHTDRQGLLRAADRLHLERFRANLIIALVQREMGHSSLPPSEPEETYDLSPRPEKYRRTFKLVAVAVTLEAVVAASAYWFYFH